jgi:hypothetical protein
VEIEKLRFGFWNLGNLKSGAWILGLVDEIEQVGVCGIRVFDEAMIMLAMAAQRRNKVEL